MVLGVKPVRGLRSRGLRVEVAASGGSTSWPVPGLSPWICLLQVEVQPVGVSGHRWPLPSPHGHFTARHAG